MNRGNRKVAAVVIALALLIIVGVSVLGHNDDNCRPGGSAWGDPGELAEGVGDLNGRQAALAQQIVAIGEARGIKEPGIITALAVANVESGFRNYANDGTGAYQSAGASGVSPEELRKSLDYPHDAVGHDHASVGTFQQQVGFWGSVEELMNPAHQAAQFYDRLEKIDYVSMTPGQAGHEIQRNATGTIYDSSVPVAKTVYAKFKGSGKKLSKAEVEALSTASGSGVSSSECQATGHSGSAKVPAGSLAGKILAIARQQFGLDYVWGGGTFDGPTGGGFDCSGLVLYAIAQATDQQVQLCHQTNCQINDPAFVPVSWEDRKPGDILYFGSPADYHHTSIYSGEKDGVPMQYEAQDFGVPLGEYPVRFGEDIQVRRLKDTSGNAVTDAVKELKEMER